MTRLIVVAGILIALAAGYMSPRHQLAGAEDNTEDRVSMLETRVSALETQVAPQPGGDTAAPTKASTSGAPIVIEGSGDALTDMFHLEEGQYKVSAEGTDRSGYGSNFIANIYESGSSDSWGDLIVNVIAPAGGSVTSSARFVANSSTDYYIEVTCDCSYWVITLEKIG